MAIKVFIALCVLTCASLLTYTTYWQEHVPMQIGRAVMLTVSLTKAYLVVAFFMHLWWESKWKYVVTFPAMAVSTLLCVALVPDVGQRMQQYDAARLLNAPEAMPYSVGSDLTVSQPVMMSSSHETGHSSGHSGADPTDRDRDSVLPKQAH
jgi:cytochrome c oxidase subunit IV